MSYRIRLLETDEGLAVSCLALPVCHSQGESRDEALANNREAITLWLEVEAEEAGVKSVETLETSATAHCEAHSVAQILALAKRVLPSAPFMRNSCNATPLRR